MSAFVTHLAPHLIDKLHADLVAQGFTLTTPPHTLFSGKKEGISCTLYLSGKLVVQGKRKQEFIEFYLEPELLQEFPFTQPLLDTTPRIGVDESGKGDFFGPLCIASLFVSEKKFSLFSSWGLCDSKKIADLKIRKLAKQIKEEAPHALITIFPKRYNELYKEFSNLNHLLAWGHAQVIATLSQETGCRNVIIDQFANENVVERALTKKKIDISLTQRHRAESDLAVAGASILARAAFLEGLDRLAEEFSMAFPKGASPAVIEAGRLFLQTHGSKALPLVAKMHFKTVASIGFQIRQNELDAAKDGKNGPSLFG